MKKIVFLIMVIAIISGVAAYFYINHEEKPNVHYPEYATATPPVETALPSETNTNRPTVSTIYFTPVTDAPTTTANTPVVPSTSGEPINPDNPIITEKDYSQENVIFLFKGVPVAKLKEGQWQFDNYNVIPSDILGVSQYYTYNYKGVKNITNTINASISKKYKKFIGTFSEEFQSLTSTYDDKTFMASFSLPVTIPEKLDTPANIVEKDISFSDNSYFATSATYNINFKKVTANAYDPFKITNMSEITKGTYNRSSITLPDDVKDYVANYMLNNFIALDINYEVSYICETDFDHDGTDEVMYVLSSYKGDKDIEYDYIETYGHFNLILLKDNGDLYEVDSSSIAAGMTKDEIISAVSYADTFYDPCVVDMNADGIYEILMCKAFDGGSTMNVYIYDNGSYIKAR